MIFKRYGIHLFCCLHVCVCVRLTVCSVEASAVADSWIRCLNRISCSLCKFLHRRWSFHIPSNAHCCQPRPFVVKHATERDEVMFIGTHRNTLFSECGCFFCLWQQVAVHVLPNVLLSISLVRTVLVLTGELGHLALLQGFMGHTALLNGTLVIWFRLWTNENTCASLISVCHLDSEMIQRGTVGQTMIQMLQGLFSYYYSPHFSYSAVCCYSFTDVCVYAAFYIWI